MNLGRFAVVAGFLTTIGSAAVAPVEAAPGQATHSPPTPSPSVDVQQVSCNCIRHVHRHRYARHYEPSYATPLYPAPPVGLTFRKLFDGGFL